MLCFFFQAEDCIRDGHVTGVQTCALPIYIETLDDLQSNEMDEDEIFQKEINKTAKKSTKLSDEKNSGQSNNQTTEQLESPNKHQATKDDKGATKEDQSIETGSTDQQKNNEVVKGIPVVTPFAGNLNVDIDISPHRDNTLAGNAAIYNLVLKRSEEHTSELQSRGHLVCRLLLEKK